MLLMDIERDLWYEISYAGKLGEKTPTQVLPFEFFEIFKNAFL